MDVVFDTTGMWLYDLMATTLARSTVGKFEYVLLVDCVYGACMMYIWAAHRDL